MDAILAKLAAKVVRIDPKREDFDYGRFAWVFDSDGNKIELWEPLGGQGYRGSEIAGSPNRRWRMCPPRMSAKLSPTVALNRTMAAQSFLGSKNA